MDARVGARHLDNCASSWRNGPGGGMIDNRLTQSERSGTVVAFSNPTPRERDAIMLHFTAMRGAKHAVVMDEINHADGSFELRLLHYKTCLCCVGAR